MMWRKMRELLPPEVRAKVNATASFQAQFQKAKIETRKLKLKPNQIAFQGHLYAKERLQYVVLSVMDEQK